MLVLAGTIGEIPRRFGAELPDLHLSSIHFVRYEDPPVVIPTVTVKGQNGRTVRGLIYAYAWGRRIKHGVVPPHFIRWPMVRLGDQTTRLVFTFDTTIEPGTVLLQGFTGLNRWGYPDSPRPTAWCNTTQGNPTPLCGIAKTNHRYAEVQWESRYLNGSSPHQWYVSLVAQWPKLSDHHLTFYQGEWLFAVRRDGHQR